jgi:hypothetical protein
MSYQLHHLQQQHISCTSSNKVTNKNDFLTATCFWKVTTNAENSSKSEKEQEQNEKDNSCFVITIRTNI